MKQKSPISYVSVSAFFHGALLLGLAVVPAFKLLPEGSKNELVELVTAADLGSGTSASLPTEAQTPPPAELPAKVAKTDEPKPVEKPVEKNIEPAQPRQPVAKKMVAEAVPLPSKKKQKKVIAINPSEPEIEKDVQKAQDEAEAFARGQDLKDVQQDTAAASPQDPEHEVFENTAQTAAAEAVAKQSEPEEQLPPPAVSEPVQRLGEIEEKNSSAPATGNDGNTSANDTGAVSGPSGDELRSYLDLKQASGNRLPQYPSTARRNGWQGQVMLNYYVTQNGQVQNVKVAKSSGYHELDSEAVRAVSQYRYVAGQEGWTSHPVVFSLKGQATPAASRLRTAGQSSSGRSE